MIIFALGLLFYSIVMLVKFLVLTTITDLRSHLTGNWKSEERNHAVNHELWMAGKSVVAFFTSICLLGLLQ